MAQNLEEKAIKEYYEHNNKLCNVLNYFGIALMGIGALDAANTYITGQPFFNHLVGNGIKESEYMLDAILAGMGAYLSYQSVDLKKHLAKEEKEKISRLNGSLNPN